jgi:hypothetical protein
VNKIEAPSLSVIAAILLPAMLIGCGERTQGGKEKTAQKSEDDFLDKDAKPAERNYLARSKTVLHCHRQPEVRGRLRAALQPCQSPDVLQPVYAC